MIELTVVPLLIGEKGSLDDAGIPHSSCLPQLLRSLPIIFIRFLYTDTLAFLNKGAFYRDIGFRSDKCLMPTALAIVMAYRFPVARRKRFVAQESICMFQTIRSEPMCYVVFIVVCMIDFVAVLASV